MNTSEATPNGATSMAITERPRAPVVSGPRGLELNSIDDMWRFATAVAISKLAPKGLDSAEACFVAIQMGAEIGLTPMASLQNIAVINGRPAVWGDAMLAVCQSFGRFDHAAFSETLVGSGDDAKAICTVRRKPDGNCITREFSVANAKRAGLWNKQGPWQQYPERMLQLRARAFALRDTFPDVLRGFRCAEEAEDDYDDGDVVDVQSSPAPTPSINLDQLAARFDAPSVAPVPVAPDPDAELAAEARAREEREANAEKKSRVKELLPD